MARQTLIKNNSRLYVKYSTHYYNKMLVKYIR